MSWITIDAAEPEIRHSYQNLEPTLATMQLKHWQQIMQPPASSLIVIIFKTWSL